MGCCGSKCCGDSSDVQGEAASKKVAVVAKKMSTARHPPVTETEPVHREAFPGKGPETAESLAERRPHPEPAAPVRSEPASAVTPVLVSTNAPYGSPGSDNDGTCYISPAPSDNPEIIGDRELSPQSAGVGDEESEDGSSITTASSPTGTSSSNGSTRSSSQTSLASIRLCDAQHTEAGAAAARARHPPRADPELADPIWALAQRPPSGMDTSAAERLTQVLSPGAAAPKEEIQDPTGEPAKQGLFRRLKQTLKPAARPGAVAGRPRGALSAIFSRPNRLLAPAEKKLRSSVQGAGMRVRDLQPNHEPRVPVLASIGPRVKRPTRPGQSLCATLPTTMYKMRRTARTAEHAPPLGSTRPLAYSPRGPGPALQLRVELAASVPGSNSAEGTSPGHSTQPDHAPVRRLLAPGRASELSDSAAHQEQSVMLPLPVLWPPELPEQSESASEEPEPVVEDSEGFRVMLRGECIMGYTVRHRLGKGAFGAVWLATHRHTGKEVALKVLKADYRATAQHETEALAAIDKFARVTRSHVLKEFRRCIVQQYSAFNLPGNAGAEYPCMVLEALGPDLMYLLECHGDQGVCAPITKVVMRQILQALHFLTAMNVCHGDVKPENVLLGSCCRLGTMVGGVDVGAERLKGNYTPRLQGETLAGCLQRQYPVKLADFGKTIFCQRERVGAPIQTLEYRSPEVVCGTRELSPAVDMWSYGCMCFEVATGDYLFDINDLETPELQLHSKLWANFICTLGKPPRAFTRPASYRLAGDFFDARGRFLEPAQPKSRPLQERLKEKQVTRDPVQQKLLLDFLSAMLKYTPGDRILPQEALTHRWLRV